MKTKFRFNWTNWTFGFWWHTKAPKTWGINLGPAIFTYRGKKKTKDPIKEFSQRIKDGAKDRYLSQPKILEEAMKQYGPGSDVWKTTPGKQLKYGDCTNSICDLVENEGCPHPRTPDCP